MPRPSPRRPRPPLDPARLDELALRYVGRFATTRAKLRAYLARKLRERGWDGAREPDLEALAERLAALGYVDDSAFATARARALSGRGYGARRVRQSLDQAGVGEDDRAAAGALVECERVEAALRFARRRRIGPFAADSPARGAPNPDAREKAIAAMVRAGHGFALARAIAELAPGSDVDLEQLAEKR